MDPSIMRLLEEDEDETMHSGADVEAFTAALNRDIEGDVSTSQPSDSDSAFSQGGNHTSNQLLSQWQTTSHDDNANYQGQQDLKESLEQEQHSSEMEVKHHGSGPENQQQPVGTSQEQSCLPLQLKQPQYGGQLQKTGQDTIHISQAMGMHENNPAHIHESNIKPSPESESQLLKLQKMSQQATATGPGTKQINRGKQVPFALLLPVILPQLDKDRAMQLQTLFTKLKQNEISKEEFVRQMRGIVGDQMLKMAVYKSQGQVGRNLQNGPNRLPSQSQAMVQHLPMPALSVKQFSDSQPFTQVHQKGLSSPADSSHVPSATRQMQPDSSNSTTVLNAQKSLESERQSGSHGIQVGQMPSSALSSANEERERPFPIQGLSKQQQQHFHFSQASFPTNGRTGSNYHYSGTSVSTSVQSLKQQFHDSQMRQVPGHPSMGATQLGTSQTVSAVSAPKFERQNSLSEAKRVQGGPISHLTNNSTLQQNAVHWQSPNSKDQKNAALPSMTYVKQEPVDQTNDQPHKSHLSTSQGLSSFSSVQAEQENAFPGTPKDESFEIQSSRIGFSTPASMLQSNSISSALTAQMDPNVLSGSRIPSTTSQVVPGSNSKTPPKKPSVGQKKPLEALGSSPPMSSKKQKVSGAFLDQSIEQLNDVTAVSGVNLREEEEQLFSGAKEDIQVSEASRRVVQEEEERLILQKIPLQKKLAEIMAKCGLKNISNDVERCLSLFVEERMRGLISSLIRLSKQRADMEKSRHRIVVTSDVRQQIMIINKKAREEWEKKQAEAEKLQKLNEPEGDAGVDGDKEKDEGRLKSVKANKEEDDKMRTTAANVAARAAVGGDDMLSKWQLMAEQARQKREGGMDVASSSQSVKDLAHNPASTTARTASNNPETDKRGYAAVVATSGPIRNFGRNQVAIPQTRSAPSISVKDVIAVLEKEPQMSKSTLIYRLYEKMHADAVAE